MDQSYPGQRIVGDQGLRPCGQPLSGEQGLECVTVRFETPGVVEATASRVLEQISDSVVSIVGFYRLMCAREVMRHWRNG